MQCINCNKECEFDSPYFLCREHWIEWFAENTADDEIQLTPQEIIEFKKELQETI
jgi:hypothetical protein